MRPSTDAAMWQITRGRGDSVYRSGSAIRHHDRLHEADEDEGGVAYNRHTGSARETVPHYAHFRAIPVDRQLSDAPLPLGLDQGARTNSSQTIGVYEWYRCLDRNDCTRPTVRVHGNTIEFSAREIVGV